MRGYRPQGMATSGRYIGEFIDWAEQRGVNHPSQVSRQVLERYQRSLLHWRKRDGEPLSINAQRAKLTPLRGFFRWLTRQALIEANPAADLELPRKLKRVPRVVLSEREAEQVLAGVPLDTALGLRDRALLEVLYATGMRRHEVARLHLGDVDAERGVVLIREGKGGKDRMIPLGERALYWLARYQAQARPELAWNSNDKTLFLGAEGKPLSLQWLSRIVAQWVDAAKLGKRGGCHLWRHTMATLMLEGGADLRYIQAMLGHAELSTTQIYTQVAIRQLQRVHAMTHPGARRRVRGQASGQAQSGEQGLQSGAGGAESQPDDPEALAAILEALDEEAQDEASNDQAGADVAADTPP